MKIFYTDRRDLGVAYAFCPTLAKLAADVDFLVIAAAGGDATRKVVDRAVLEAVGPEGILADLVVRNLEAHFSGTPLLTPFNH